MHWGFASRTSSWKRRCFPSFICWPEVSIQASMVRPDYARPSRQRLTNSTTERGRVAQEIPSTHRTSHGMNRLVLVAMLGLSLPLGAQTTPGYSQQAAIAERATEADAIARPSPSSASAHSRFLSLQPHMAGTPAQARTRDYVINQMKSWGLETEVRSYSVWMPHPVSTRVWRFTLNPDK